MQLICEMEHSGLIHTSKALPLIAAGAVARGVYMPFSEDGQRV